MVVPIRCVVAEQVDARGASARAALAAMLSTMTASSTGIAAAPAVTVGCCVVTAVLAEQAVSLHHPLRVVVMAVLAG